WVVWWVFKQITGKEGMGHGDFKLLAAIGAWTGLMGILPTILFSSLVGAIIGSVWLAMKGRDRATPIPFGPYLAIAGWITFFWGERIVGGYMRYSGLGWGRSGCSGLGFCPPRGLPSGRRSGFSRDPMIVCPRRFLIAAEAAPTARLRRLRGRLF